MTYFAYSSILMWGKRQAMHYKPNQSKEMTQRKFQIQEMLWMWNDLKAAQMRYIA